jgi:hypothetical protein
MGTSAVFQVQGCKKILGVTSDGFSDNLIWVAHLFAETARAMRVLTKVHRNDPEAILAVLTAISEYKKVDWFLDDPSNASWVRNSAILLPQCYMLDLYDAHFGAFDRRVAVRLDHAGTKSHIGELIAKAEKARQKALRVQKIRRMVDIENQIQALKTEHAQLESSL